MLENNYMDILKMIQMIKLFMMFIQDLEWPAVMNQIQHLVTVN